MGLLQESPTDSFFHKEKLLGSLAQLGCLCTELQHRHLVFSGPPQDISTSAVVGRSAARKPMPPFPPPQSAAAPTLPQAGAAAADARALGQAVVEIDEISAPPFVSDVGNRASSNSCAVTTLSSISAAPTGSLLVQLEKHCCGGWRSIGDRWRSH